MHEANAMLMIAMAAKNLIAFFMVILFGSCFYFTELIAKPVTKVGVLYAGIEANFVSGVFRLDFEKGTCAGYRILIKNIRL